MHGNYLLLMAVLLIAGAATAIAVVVAMAFGIVRPPRMSDGKALWLLRRLSPEDMGLAFEEMSFAVRDEQSGQRMNIAGWWIPSCSLVPVLGGEGWGEGRTTLEQVELPARTPGPSPRPSPPSTGERERSRTSDRTVILLHGYADAKVGAIAWAPLWHSLGFNILAVDLRAHGESDGRFCTAGYFERHDLSQVIDQLLADRPAASRELLLFGVSLGAATALATAAMREDISAVVLESPPADFQNSAMAHMDRIGAPGPAFQRIALRLAARLAGCEFDAVRPIDLLSRVSCPVMIVAPKADPLVSDGDRDRLRGALGARSRGEEDVWWDVNSGHLVASAAEPAEYERRLSEFVARLPRRCAAHAQ